MIFDIKTIEDLSLNAWPSHQMQVYDGWIIRFSHFYTHRTNSVEQIGPSSLPLPEKIEYCEQIYRRWNTPSIFKITPLSHPLLEPLLIEQGYHIEHSTDVMVLDLEQDYLEKNTYNIEETRTIPIKVQHHIAPAWIESLFQLKNTTNLLHRKIVPSMYAAIPKDVVAVSIRKKGARIATGLGILDRDYIGIYAIHVAEEYRHRGYAAAVVHTLLSEGSKKGATKAYLQVVSDNAPALNLYQKIGFKKLYTYWFRVKEVCDLPDSSL